MEYEKQTFVNGQVLTAECLNRMEEGIKGACDAAPPACEATDCSKVLSHGANGCEWIDPPGGALIVTVTDGVADHTSAEIYAHAQSGSVVLEYEGERWALNHCAEEYAIFERSIVEEGVFTGVNVYEDGGIERFESVIPTSYSINSLIKAKLAANTLTVTITDGVASHTSAEIYAHVQAGGTAVLNSGIAYVLTGSAEDYASFDHNYDDGLRDNILVYDDGSVGYREYQNFDTRDIQNFVLRPTAAEVGQALVVKSVNANGKPATWECASIYTANQIDTMLGSYITDIDTLIGGES